MGIHASHRNEDLACLVVSEADRALGFLALAPSAEASKRVLQGGALRPSQFARVWPLGTIWHWLGG